MKDCILFIQNRSGKSGAPVALSRLLRHPEILKFNPILLTSKRGWLSEQCDQFAIPSIIEAFPSSRSAFGLLWKNKSFTKKIINRLRKKNLCPRLIIGNDHLEGILANDFKKNLQIPSVVFLRSSQTTKDVYFKYQCHLASQCYTVSEQLQQRVLDWDSNSGIKILHDGLYEKEILSPKSIPPDFPSKILIAGNESPNKGWPDLVQAIDELEKNSQFPSLEFDFTGEQTASFFQKNRRAKFNFISRGKNFTELVREYDLVIHPSRAETFGLAMIETLAAGVPLLCSRVGIIEKIQKNKTLLFEPNNSSDLACKLQALWEKWSSIDFQLEECQNLIRKQFLIDHIAGDLSRDLEELIHSHHD